jgi:hypothetical protein
VTLGFRGVGTYNLIAFREGPLTLVTQGLFDTEHGDLIGDRLRIARRDAALTALRECFDRDTGGDRYLVIGNAYHADPVVEVRWANGALEIYDLAAIQAVAGAATGKGLDGNIMFVGEDMSNLERCCAFVVESTTRA